MSKFSKGYVISLFVLLVLVFIPVTGGYTVFAQADELQELYNRIKQLEAENAALQATVTPQPESTPTPKPTGPAKLQMISNPTINLVNGTMRDVEIIVRNFGSTIASNVFNTAAAASDAPIQAQFAQNSTNTTNVGSNSEVKLTLRVTVDANAKEGVYPVTLTYQYKDNSDTLKTDTDTINIKITSTVTPPEIAIVDFSASESEFLPGGGFKLSAQISNIGGAEAKNIQLMVEGMSSDTIYMSNTSNTYQYSTLNSGQRIPVEFDFIVSGKAKPGTNLLTFSAIYKDKDNKEFKSSFSYYATISVSRLSEDKASVEIVNLTAPDEDIAPGQEFSVYMDVVNNGNNTAKNIKIVAAADTDDAIVPRSSNMTVISGLAAGETKQVEFKFSPTAKAKNQNYALSFKAEYETGALDSSDNPEKLSFEQYTGVNVITEAENTKSAVIRIGSIEGPSRAYGVGENFSISIVMTNTGEYVAENIKISSVTDAEGAIVPMSSNLLNITSLEAGESNSIEFMFAPTEKSRTRNYALEFNVEYETGVKDSSGVMIKESFQQFFGVNVINDEPEATPSPSEKRLSRPKIIIESYITDPIIVKAGQEFDLNMVFKNTHETKTITNIKAELTPNETTTTKGSVFIPVNGSTTFYIDRILPLDTADKTFRMYTIPDAEPRNYTITVTFKYQDEEFYDHEESETIGITVKQTTRLSTGTYSVPEEGYVGAPIYLYFSIMNTGKSTLNNLMVVVEGNFDTTKSFNYFGTVNKSSSAYYDGEFTPTEPGLQKGKIVMTFEDETGEESVIEREFSINVVDMSEMMADREMGMGMDMPMPVAEKSITDTIKEYAMKPVVWAGAAAFLVVIIIIRRIIKNRKRVKFDE